MLQLNKANISDNEIPLLDLYLSVISNGLVWSKIYDKRDYFDFDIVNYGDDPRFFNSRFKFFNLSDLLECIVM